MPPGTPCPTPDYCTCNFERKQRTPVIFVLLLVVGGLMSASIALGMAAWAVYGAYRAAELVVGSAIAADNDRACLTKEQARAKWPKDYLYWHGVNHCWDNVRTYAKPDRTHKSGKPPVDANGNIATARYLTQEQIDNLQFRYEAERRLKTCCWPPLPDFAPWDERIK